MYKIGEFSRITNLSIKTLRYYDKEGILVPAKRGEESSYRFYDTDNFDRAILIKKLREFQFSISEIKDVLSLYHNENDLYYILSEKKELIQKEIDLRQKLIEKMNASVNLNNEEKAIMEYEIKVKEIPEVKVASIRYKDHYDKCGNYVAKLYKTVKSNVNGAFFNLYYDMEYAEHADIESCIPLKKDIYDSNVSCRTLPKIKGISTIHKGSYASLSHSYKALLDYANQHNLEIAIPTREIYIKGPGMIFKGNPNKYITEIIIPIIEKDGVL